MRTLEKFMNFMFNPTAERQFHQWRLLGRQTSKVSVNGKRDADVIGNTFDWPSEGLASEGLAFAAHNAYRTQKDTSGKISALRAARGR